MSNLQTYHHFKLDFQKWTIIDIMWLLNFYMQLEAIIFSWLPYHVIVQIIELCINIFIHNGSVLSDST